MYKHIELHNHTTESDGGLSVEALVTYMEDNKVDAFAITDHNTTSGHHKLMNVLKNRGSIIEAIYGIEYTTYYGHILAFNIEGYRSWENINRHDGDGFLRAIKETAGLVGIAHPFAYSFPLATSGFVMKVQDRAVIDFIEVWNNDEDMTYELNAKAIEWWENMILDGERVSATAGLDLHGPTSIKNKFATYIEVCSNEKIGERLEKAISRMETWVSRGVLLIVEKKVTENKLRLSIIDMNQKDHTGEKDSLFVITLRSLKDIQVYECNYHEVIEVEMGLFEEGTRVVPKLYEATVAIEKLMCIAPVVII